MTAFRVPYEVYSHRPLAWTLKLISALTPKEKKKTTAEELNKVEHVEVELWQPPIKSQD
ncbi:hypothetical protein KMC93_gp30 [Lactococcus phage vB_Llc_bIBBp6/4]|uniref:Uncharacterized protein n=1 Tax=Lactococcus phage vB_Llc_bIBBp6/4 TaxID=2305489 RepID=A0A678VI59_9CAUD|nr:hypothetical protein KMC93_gp30 [Lactococcus phage vB_Llc_bIBBp6/4]AXY83874.1 hypothetical protein bIBBp6/4_gp10 [Lactococcus phage vB_Llc_bIBBp6/4]